MDRTPREILVVVVIVVAVVLALFASIAVLRRNPDRHPPPFVLDVTLDSERLTGDPSQNTSQIWIARVTSVTWNLSVTSYRAGLLVNGTVAIPAAPVHPGELGRAGAVVFEFFDEGLYCYPTPCPPPEGPDGNLTVGDYFRLSSVSVDTVYSVQVVWEENGAVVGEIVIRT